MTNKTFHYSNAEPSFLKFMYYLKALLAGLCIVCFIGLVAFTEEWILSLLRGAMALLGFSIMVLTVAEDGLKYGHLKLNSSLMLMAGMLIFGVYIGINLVGNENRLGDNDRVLIMHGLNSLVSRAAANDDGELLAFWCQEHVRYEQQFKGWRLPDMPEACKKT